MMERQRPQSKVSLEDLLRLKRAERPAPEFWAEFEDQLRRKQLAAIVDKRPWWRRLSAVALAKIYIPVSATAVVAFTLVTVRDRSQPSASGLANAPAAVVASHSVPDGTPLGVTEVQSEVETVSVGSPAAAGTATAEPATTSFANTSSSSRGYGDAPSVSSSLPETVEPSLAQVIMGIAGTFEGDVSPQSPPVSSSVLASLSETHDAQSSRLSSLSSNSVSDVSAPRDDRRARLLASIDSSERDLVSGNSRVTRSRDRIASRLTEQALYDSISRLGLNGDSVSIRF